MGRIPRPRAGWLICAAVLAAVCIWSLARTAVRWRNLRALDRLVAAHDTQGAVEFTLTHFDLGRPAGWRALRRMAIEILRQGLDERDPYERCFAATSLIVYGDWSGLNVIRSAMGAKDIFLQKAAIEGLADTRDPRALDLLRSFYGAGNRRLRVWTIEALA